MADPVKVSETWQYDEDDDVLIDCSTSPTTRYPASCLLAKIGVYESRVRDWFLGLADSYVAEEPSRSDYVALSIALAYIEGVEQFRQGQDTPMSQSGNWFKASAARIFPNAPDKALDRLWREARCGLFHSGFTDGRTYLSHKCKDAIAIIGEDMEINPRLFVNAVLDDFSTYVSELRAAPNSDLSLRFESLWDLQWKRS
jgi:hypothetical protein